MATPNLSRPGARNLLYPAKPPTHCISKPRPILARARFDPASVFSKYFNFSFYSPFLPAGVNLPNLNDKHHAYAWGGVGFCGSACGAGAGRDGGAAVGLRAVWDVSGIQGVVYGYK